MTETTTAVEVPEPSLAPGILRYANSVAFAGLREITDVFVAVAQLANLMTRMTWRRFLTRRARSWTQKSQH